MDVAQFQLKSGLLRKFSACLPEDLPTKWVDAIVVALVTSASSNMIAWYKPVKKLTDHSRKMNQEHGKQFPEAWLQSRQAVRSICWARLTAKYLPKSVVGLHGKPGPFVIPMAEMVANWNYLCVPRDRRPPASALPLAIAAAAHTAARHRSTY